jgi:glycosyltransferase involved in cell wall biosynthesis
LIVLSPVLVLLSVVLLVAVAALVCCPTLSVASAVSTVGLASATGAAVAQLALPVASVRASAAAVLTVPIGCWLYARSRPTMAPVGAVVWATWVAFGVVATVWGVLFLSSLRLSTVSTALLWSTIGLTAVTLPSAVVTTREGWDPLLRKTAGRGPTPGRRFATPRVSIHVPCHAEPPDVVIGTLDRLADLDYPDFEVIVIDNNTLDEQLWRPLERHCDRLGPRFRFLHVEGVTGAKAGALNIALRRTDPAARLVAVVDADYRVQPDWLRRTVGHFTDPEMGFVQGPHAYRDFHRGRFGRWANAEYSVFFAAGMVSLDRHGAGLTVGTMSLINRDALDRVGGWSEWCLTEDSELAIRIHAAGYRSKYLTETYGHGLIPQTFAAYRQQRFRWTYGPVQELRNHWRLFLPRAFGATRSKLTPRQKLHHANHGIDVICVGLRALAVPLAAATACSMLVHHEHVAVPMALWAASTSVLATDIALRLLVYRRIVEATLRQAIGGTIAFAGLSLVITVASLKGALGRPAAWHRTAKFTATRTGARALRQAAPESALALSYLVAAVSLLSLAPLGGIITMLSIALILQAATLFAACALALIADASLPRASSPAYGDSLQPVSAAA